MKRIVAYMIAFILLFSVPVTVSAEGEPKETQLYARSACLMDAQTGRVLYEKDGYNSMANASTTKIMTCILALENGNLSDIVTVSEKAAKQPKVHLGARAGDQFRLEDLLYSLMLESHNDSAVMIAEQISGSVEAFADMMNQKAREIGCTGTHFVTPNGLDGQDDGGKHATTARDLGLIMRYCIMQSPQREKFLEITRTPAYTFWNQKETTLYNCNNHNAFLSMMEGALSGKTGFTADAGYCYVGALQRDGKTFIVSLLACGWPNNKTYKWSDTKTLMNYGLEQYSYRDVLSKELPNPVITVANGQYQGSLKKDSAQVPVSMKLSEDETLPVLLRQDENVEIRYELPEKLDAPVEKGSEIGKVQYLLNNEVLKEYPVYAEQNVKKIDFAWCFGIIKNKYLMIHTRSK